MSVHRWAFVVFVLAFGAHARGQLQQQQPDRRVLIISVDGLRPDCVLRADMPNVRGLMQRGSYSFWARTTDVAITLPSHTSMLTGVRPEKHHVTWNDDLPKDQPQRYPEVPTLFELAKARGLSTAIVTGKRKFIALARPGSIDWLDLPSEKLRIDEEVGAAAVRVISSHRPRVMLLHFGINDSIGHADGWGSPQQIAHLRVTDAMIGKALSALSDARVLDQTLIILSSDHGGFERVHGPNPNDQRAHTIPWIVAGPNVRSDFDLTRIKPLSVRTEDTFATAAAFLGLTPSPDIDGRAIGVIFEDLDLLRDAVDTKQPTAATQPSK